MANYNNIDFNNVKETADQIELNNLTSKVSKGMKKEGVEIFSAIINGKDTSKYGKKVDTTMAFIKDLGNKAIDGTGETKLNAKAELNAIREILIATPLQKRINAFSLLGTTTQVGLNEEVRYKVFELKGKKARVQANSDDFPFPTQKYRTEVMGTKTITGGMVVDYREYATGNVDSLGVVQEQVVTNMMDQMNGIIISSLYNGIKKFGGFKNFVESAGLTKTAVDAVITKARRFDKNLTLYGDISVIQQMPTFTGFTTDTVNNIKLFSQAIMEEIRQSGILKMYNGMPVVEMDNEYDLTTENATNTFYDTMLPEGLLFVLPKSIDKSPLQIGIKGGVTSMSATDIRTRSEVQRFDLEFGTAIIPEYIPFVGLVSDTNFTVNKYQ